MEIRIKRTRFGTKATTGEMFIDDIPTRECVTLEDVVRPAGVKVQNETAIPPGRYEVVINYSNRFKRMMPQVLNVPGFEGIRIHNGNTDADTDGCILVGENRANDDFIEHSVAAFSRLFLKLQDAATRGKIMLTITNEPA